MTGAERTIWVRVPGEQAGCTLLTADWPGPVLGAGERGLGEARRQLGYSRQTEVRPVGWSRASVVLVRSSRTFRTRGSRLSGRHSGEKQAGWEAAGRGKTTPPKPTSGSVSVKGTHGQILFKIL